jgi:hypothetical protein
LVCGKGGFKIIFFIPSNPNLLYLFFPLAGLFSRHVFPIVKDLKSDLMNRIIIIGTEPPCPRCKLMTKIVTDKVKELGINVVINHAVYTDPESGAFAGQLGLEPGTASSVAKKMNVVIDNSRKIIPDFDSEFNTEYEDYFFTNWSYELDEHLRIYETNAKELGILMTPSLIINGELKHSGSVPRLSQIEAWLMELKEV